MATANNYDQLYSNMKTRLTVVSDNAEYTIGDYMLMRANKKKVEALMPTAEKTVISRTEQAITNAVSYINEKLIIKEPPVKDKTIRAFPFRASASALLSAVACCALVISIAVVGMGSQKHNNEMLDNVSMTDYYIEDAVELHREVV